MNAPLSHRVRPLNQLEYRGGPVVYLAQPGAAARDNWALFYAQQLALSRQAPLAVVFNRFRFLRRVTANTIL